MRANRMLIGVVVIQGLLLLGQWAGRDSTAHAKPEIGGGSLPDPGARQLQMIEELKGVNAKLDRLLTMAQNGEVQVKVKPEEKR